MKYLKKIINNNKKIIKYGIFGIITVIINLALYKIFLMIKMNYVVASVVSYIIASLISYYFNLFCVFQKKIDLFIKEIQRIIKYFSVRIVSLASDTILLIVAVELFKFDEFYSKIIISIIIILFTYILNKKILDKEN